MLFCFNDVDSTALHLYIKVIESIEYVSHVCQHNSELKVLELICRITFMFLQKLGQFLTQGKGTIQPLSSGRASKHYFSRSPLIPLQFSTILPLLEAMSLWPKHAYAEHSASLWCVVQRLSPGLQTRVASQHGWSAVRANGRHHVLRKIVVPEEIVDKFLYVNCLRCCWQSFAKYKSPFNTFFSHNARTQQAASC